MVVVVVVVVCVWVGGYLLWVFLLLLFCCCFFWGGIGGVLLFVCFTIQYELHWYVSLEPYAHSMDIKLAFQMDQRVIKTIRPQRQHSRWSESTATAVTVQSFSSVSWWYTNISQRCSSRWNWYIYIYADVCVRLCVRACVRVCVCLFVKE